jgi:hypothetical protein
MISRKTVLCLAVAAAGAASYVVLYADEAPQPQAQPAPAQYQPAVDLSHMVDAFRH